MDINEIAAQAAAKIDAARDKKIDAVRTVAASGVELREAADLPPAAEQKPPKDYPPALRPAWTETALRGFGIDAPAHKAGGRPRGSRKPRRSTSAQAETVGAE